MCFEERLHVFDELSLTAGAGVEHVAAGVLVDLDAAGVGDEGHGVDGEDGAHEGAAQIVPAVGDEHVHFGVGGDGLAQVVGGAVAQGFVAVPVLVDGIGERVVAGGGLPADDAGDPVDHGLGGGGDDGGEDGVVRLLVGREGEGVHFGHVGVVNGADFVLFAVDFAQVGADVEASAGVFNEGGVEPGELGDFRDDARGGLGVGAAGEEVGGVLAAVVGYDGLHALGGELVLAFEVRGDDRRQAQHPRERRDFAIAFNPRVEVGRDQDEAVDADAELRLQVVRDGGAAEAAVALTDDVLAGLQALAFDEPVIDDLREVVDVGLGGVEELFGLLWIYQRAREAGADGSIKTISEKGSQVPGLSLRRGGSEGLSPCPANSMCLGPMAPKFR